MKPGEVAAYFELFKQEVTPLKGDDLLDKWIAFDGSPDSKVPDLGLLKSECLQAALMQQFGIHWKAAVDARRKAKSEDA